MLLDLRDIIEIPGSRKAFSQTLDTDLLDFPSVLEYTAPITAEGEVRNTAGVLELRGALHAEMRCACDRCGKVFSRAKDLPLRVTLTANPEEDDDPEIFALTGDAIDLDEVLSTCFVLDMEAKCLCREDCAGLCPTCGADLNLGACNCRQPRDPRMAVLEQLLDDN
ncbi:MAG: DUF177 domain-containing protein [Oscillospiraceae bacterium]|nr:DUF177 domain-containing protein [Oscillospiraceae bacterium]